VMSRTDPLFTSTHLLDGVVAGDVRTSLQLRLPGRGDNRSPADGGDHSVRGEVRLLRQRELGHVHLTLAEALRAPGQVLHVALVDLFGLDGDSLGPMGV
jgi:hypothetical protein